MPIILSTQIGQNYNSQVTIHQQTIKSCFPMFRVSACTTVDDVDKLKSVVTHCVTHLALCRVSLDFLKVAFSVKSKHRNEGKLLIAIDRALPSEGRGLRFESSWVRHFLTGSVTGYFVGANISRSARYMPPLLNPNSPRIV